MAQKPTEDTIQFLENRLLDADVRPKVMRRGSLRKNPDGTWKNEEDDKVAMIIDKATSTVTYFGWAAIGTATSDDDWRIKRMSVAGDVTTFDWADGNSDYDNVWDNRAALSYS